MVAHERLLESARLFGYFLRNISCEAILDIQVKNLPLDAQICVPTYLYLELAELVLIREVLPPNPFKLSAFVAVFSLLGLQLLFDASQHFDRLQETHPLLAFCEQRISQVDARPDLL